MIRNVSKVVLYDARGRLVMQERDYGKDAKNPGKLSFFGGGVEAGELHKVAALRELTEETNILAKEQDLAFLTSKYVWDKNELIRVHYFQLSFPANLSALEVYEGSRFVLLDPHEAQRAKEFTPLTWRYLRKLRRSVSV